MVAAPSLLADIAIYNVNNFDHGHIEDSSIYGPTAHVFCDHFSNLLLRQEMANLENLLLVQARSKC